MVEKSDTFDNLLEMMTKALPSMMFKHCLDLVGICTFKLALEVGRMTSIRDKHLMVMKIQAKMEICNIIGLY